MDIFYHYYPSTNESQFNLLSFVSTACSQEQHNFFINLAQEVDFDLPETENIRYLKYPNYDLDWGGLSRFIENEYLDFCAGNLMVINSSAAGPFFPRNLLSDWAHLFADRLSPQVQLVGTSISCLPLHALQAQHFLNYYNECDFKNFIPHVQTFAFLLGREAISLLRSKSFFNRTFDSDRISVISGYELSLSDVLLKSGFGITSVTHPGPPIFLSGLENIAWGDIQFDYMFPKGYGGSSLHPYESIFVKTRRYPPDLLVELQEIKARELILRFNLVGNFD